MGINGKVELLWEEKQSKQNKAESCMTQPYPKALFHLKQRRSHSSTHQPGLMMENFPDTDKSTTVDPKRHSGLWMSPMGPPSITKDS